MLWPDLVQQLAGRALPLAVHLAPDKVSNRPSHFVTLDHISKEVLALALFEHAVAGLGEDGATAKSWLKVEPFLLFPALWVSGQSKVWVGARCMQWSGAQAGARGAW